MIGELLNEQSLMYTALSEMIYDQTDISDSTKYGLTTPQTFFMFTFMCKNIIKMSLLSSK